MSPVVIVEWLEPYSHEFFVLKGLIGVAAVVLMIVHMLQVWADIPTAGRRLRYLALLAAATVVASGSYEQVYDDAVVNWRNVGGLLAAVLIGVAAVVSIIEDGRSTTSASK